MPIHRSARWARIVQAYLASKRGNISIMAAGASVMIIGLASLAVDWGSLTLEHRRAQGLTDLTAMSAAANLDNHEAIIRAMLADNGFEDTTIILNDPEGYAAQEPQGDGLIAHVELGSYVADRSVQSTDRFRAGIEPYDAVRVTKRQLGTLHFAKGLGKPDPIIETQALARAKKTASMSIGSRLLRLDGGVLNALLGAALGSNLTLTVADYEALLDAQMSLSSILDANRRQLGLTAATYEELLDADLTYDDFAKALRADEQVTGPAGRALSLLIQNNQNQTQFSLSDMIDSESFGMIGNTDPSSALSAEVSLLRALTAAALVASGDHQVEFSLGLDQVENASVDVVLAIGEKEKFLTGLSHGGEGSVAKTAQVRLGLHAKVGGSGLLSSASIELPLMVEVASGEATLSDLTCKLKNPEQSKAIVNARPGLVSAYLGTPSAPLADDFDTSLEISPANILSVPTLNVKAMGEVEVGNLRPTALTFSADDVERGVIKRASTTQAVQSLTLSLMNNTELDISALGLSVGATSLIQTALISQAAALTAPLDEITANLLAVLGVSVGEVDVRVHDIQCDRSKLVQ